MGSNARTGSSPVPGTEGDKSENSEFVPFFMPSNSALPFYITNPPIALLPVEKHQGEWRSILTTSLVTMSKVFKDGLTGLFCWF